MSFAEGVDEETALAMKADPEQCPLDRVCEIGVCEEGLLCTGGYSCAGPTQMYVMSLYFAICSVSGVGAVIATPYNTTEQLLAGFIHLLTGMIWVRAAERSYRLPHSSHLFSPHLISTSHLLTPPHTSSHLLTPPHTSTLIVSSQAYLIGVFTSLASNFSPTVRAFRDDLSRLNSFMSMNNLPSETRYRLRE